jgi:amidase
MIEKMRPLDAHAFEPFTMALIEEYLRQGPASLERARAALQSAGRKYLAATESYDVVLTPTVATTPWRIGHLSPILPRPELLARTSRTVGYTPVHNVTGSPAMSVPLFWSDEGLPIGAQFAAELGDEATLLGLAYELEAARPWRDRWAPYSYPRLFGA